MQTLSQETAMDIQASQITDFVYSHLSYKVSKEEYSNSVKAHMKYKTCIILYDEKGIAAFARFNVKEKPRTFEILDCVIRKDCRNRLFMYYMIKKGLDIFPKVKYITFQRGQRLFDRGYRKYKIKDFLKRS